MLYINANVKNLERWYRWGSLQGRNRHADREQMCDTVGKGRVRFTGRLGLTYIQSACQVTSVVSTLWNPMDHSRPCSSVHGIFHTRTLEWVAIPFSRGSSLLRDRTQVSCTVGRFFTLWSTREVWQRPGNSANFQQHGGKNWEREDLGLYLDSISLLKLFFFLNNEVRVNELNYTSCIN